MATKRSASRTSGGTAHVLPRERAGASFDVDALTRISTKGKHAALRRFRPPFASNPLFDEEGGEADVLLSYADGFRRSIKKVAEAFRIIRANPEFMIAHMRSAPSGSRERLIRW